MVLDRGDPLSTDEVVEFQAKPNVILYALEAPRIVLLFIIGLNIMQICAIHFWKGTSLVFLLKLTLLIDFMLVSIFLLLVMLTAAGLTFVATRTDVGIRFMPFGIAAWRVFIPIEDIKSIEVRTYGRHHGSVYFDRLEQSTRGAQPKAIDLLGGSANDTAWLSLPWSWPPLIGFYGFRNYDELVRIVLRTHALKQRNIAIDAIS
jgi:hypothetical protein